jgi:AcrR family transcriptional regulator
VVPKPPKKREWEYGELTVPDIVATALSLIEREGVAKLSMRRLADELGLSSMGTYYYIPNKEVLLDLVSEEVLLEIYSNLPDTTDWQEYLRGYSIQFRQTLLRYPGLPSVMLTRPNTPTGKRLADKLADLLVENGFEEHVVDDAVFSLGSYVLSSVAWDTSAPARQRGARRSTFSDRPITFKHTSTAANSREAADRRAELGIDIYVKGLAELRREAIGKSSQPSPRRRARARPAG